MPVMGMRLDLIGREPAKLVAHQGQGLVQSVAAEGVRIAGLQGCDQPVCQGFLGVLVVEPAELRPS